MARAIVLGAGMVGSTMAVDLASEPGLQVTVADLRPAVLAHVEQTHGLRTQQADLSDPAAVSRVVAEYDIVLGALASRLGLATLRAVIEAGKPYCDISFMPEDPSELSALAEARGVTAVVDCGVAPGMSNLLAGHAAATLDPCQRIEIYVGGLPVERRWPWQYKAGFSPHDVIEEYLRPSRVVEGGHVVVKEALSGVELLDFPGVGTLEAFNTDGLRTLVRTLAVPDMVEKTMRYPGHAELMRVLRETGLFSTEPLSLPGGTVRPLDLTAALLFPRWTFEDGEADLTVMRVVAHGRRDGRQVRLSWDLLDRYDPATRTRSMSRTTAFPATIVARLILSGRIARRGVFAPEGLAAEPGLVDEVLAQLERRGVHYSSRVE